MILIECANTKYGLRKHVTQLDSKAKARSFLHNIVLHKVSPAFPALGLVPRNMKHAVFKGKAGRSCCEYCGRKGEWG